MPDRRMTVTLSIDLEGTDTVSDQEVIVARLKRSVENLRFRSNGAAVADMVVARVEELGEPVEHQRGRRA